MSVRCSSIPTHDSCRHFQVHSPPDLCCSWRQWLVCIVLSCLGNRCVPCTDSLATNTSPASLRLSSIQCRYKTIETLRRLQQDSSPNTPCQRPGPLPCQSGFTYRHNKTQNTNVRTQPLAYPCRLPEDAERPIFVPVEDGGNDTVNIG